MRTCCDSNQGFAHRKDCKWARANCPHWIDPFLTAAVDPGTRAKLYREALRDTVLMKTYVDGVKKSGKITYIWLGGDGWPVAFRVNDEWNWDIDDVVCISGFHYCYPRLPTAEEIYELISRQT
jgi:hypothetical protein